MPRHITAVEENPELHIPNLTLENVSEIASQADHVAISFSGNPPRRYYDNKYPDKVALHRWMFLWDKLSTQVLKEHYIESGHTAKNGRYQHAFIYEPDVGIIQRIISFFESMVPLWSEFTISFCWTDHPHPRVNTLVYEVFDNMPPEPDTEQFFNELGFDIRELSRNEMSEEHIEQYEAQANKYYEYEETETEPRYSFGVTHVLNGDYDAGGADIAMYTKEYLNMDIRFLPASKRDTNTITFPAIAGTPLYETVINELPDYPNNILVDKINDRTLVAEDEITAPLNPTPE